MAKLTLRLTERIAVRASTKKPTQGAKNRATFLALRDEIKESLTDGWSVKIIWETLYEEKKVDFSYQAFRKYVNQLIPGRQPSVPNPLEKATDTKPKTDQTENTSTPINPVMKRTGFDFSPVPDKEQLIG